MTEKQTHPNVFMIGGPNGAGKTTTAMTLLPKFLDVFEFVNADEIARGLNPIKPETADVAAGRIMIRRIGDLIASKKNFAFETTCAGHHHVETLKACRKAGYRVNLVFYWLPSADMAVERVQFRVRQGGHNIPETTIRRRYVAGLINLVKLYIPLSDMVLILDNSKKPMHDEISNVIMEIYEGKEFREHYPVIWKQILSTSMKE